VLATSEKGRRLAVVVEVVTGIPESEEVVAFINSPLSFLKVKNRNISFSRFGNIL